MRNDGEWSALFPGMATSPGDLNFAASLTLDITNLGSKPRKPSSQRHVPDKDLLFSQQGLQPREENRQLQRNPRYSSRCLSLSSAKRWNAAMAKETEGRRFALESKIQDECRAD
jgi:hypothetical protein